MHTCCIFQRGFQNNVIFYEYVDAYQNTSLVLNIILKSKPLIVHKNEKYFDSKLNTMTVVVCEHPCQTRVARWFVFK
jgi:hypothetical protein